VLKNRYVSIIIILIQFIREASVDLVFTTEISISFKARARIDRCLNPSVTHSFTVKPLWVRIQGESRPLSAGKTYEIGCEVVGARPSPTITWSKGNMILRNARETVQFKIHYQ